MDHQFSMQAWVGSLSNKCHPDTKVQDVNARISSRITTGIRVVINFTETITVLMSHSQFRYIKTYT
jgi:hypothetical protein